MTGREVCAVLSLSELISVLQLTPLIVAPAVFSGASILLFGDEQRLQIDNSVMFTNIFFAYFRYF